jgi:hypothetical protein
MKSRRLGLLGLLISLLAASASAQVIWKWRDADGRIQISDRAPPAEVPDKDILQRPTNLRQPASSVAASAPGVGALSGVSADSPASAPSGDAELEIKKRRLLAEQLAAKEAIAAVAAGKARAAKAESCKRAQAQLKMLESGQRVARPNDKGEMQLLDDKGRAEEVRRVQGAANIACN